MPHLADLPVALVGDDGLLLVTSEQTERFGVRPGQSASAARALCPALITLPYDRATYEDSARCLWDLFAIESSVVEPVSPEVCYVELEGRDIPDRVRQLAAAVSSRVATPVRVGLGASKFIALQAAMRTGGKAISVPVGGEATFLSPVSLDCVPGIERKVRERLNRLGVRTFGDILSLPPSQLHRLGKDIGPLLQRLAHGLDGDRVRPLWPPKSVESSQAFEDETCDEATIQEALRRSSVSITDELAVSREYCKSVKLLVGFEDRSYRQDQERLHTPINGCVTLFRAALRLLHRIVVDKPVVELVLTVSDIGIGSGVQLALIDSNAHALGLPHERRAKLESVLAYLRRKYPLSAPVLGSLLKQSKRVNLWTYPLGHALMIPVEVTTNRNGEPLRFRGLRHRRPYEREVKRILTHWKESEWQTGPADTEVWRIEADENGISDLKRLGVEWRLASVAD